MLSGTAAPTNLVGSLGQRKVDVWFNCHDGMVGAEQVDLHADALKEVFSRHRSALQRDLLADPDPAKLPFLEVRVDIGRAYRHDRHHRTARRDALADLDLAVVDDAVDRRADHRAGKIDPGLLQLCPGRRDIGIGVDRRTGDQRVIGRMIAPRRITRVLV